MAFPTVHQNSLPKLAKFMDFKQFFTLFGKSKDGVLLLSILKPVRDKFHLFANIISKFDSWPTNAKCPVTE